MACGSLGPADRLEELLFARESASFNSENQLLQAGVQPQRSRSCSRGYSITERYNINKTGDPCLEETDANSARGFLSELHDYYGTSSQLWLHDAITYGDGHVY